ncbi:GSCOCG00009715001-RA-CDS [Cotesia congregata]|nr:GSCOCG00009715001-RA-CDS [Cotesia congregata]
MEVKFFLLRIFILAIYILKIEGMKTYCPGVEVLETGGISCELKDEILKKHNELRNSIASGLVDGQPPAENMRELYWDEELAKGAQEWANHCTFAHNPAEARRIGRFKIVGQNIGITRSHLKKPPTKKDFAKQIKKWFDENEFFNFNPINPTDIANAGHYTQLAWANTYLVGCGFTRYLSEGVTYRLYVCNYAVGGNYLKTLPYIKGVHNCPEEFPPSATYPALCATEGLSESTCDADEDKSVNSPISSLPPQVNSRKSLVDEMEYSAYDNEENRQAFGSKDIEPTDLGSERVYVRDLHVDAMYNIFYYLKSRH